ncbi:MAG: SDR family oxidoreductase [Synergistales bacterium]|nr:SDR family oxidoreductase [Synergistales bacterium]
MDLSSKKILISGGSSGIGAATASELASVGAKCLLLARDGEKLAKVVDSLPGDGHRSYPFDLTDLKGISGLLESVVSENGPLYGLVHCAGVDNTQPFRSMALEDLDSIMDLNFKSFWCLAQGFVKKKAHTSDDSRVISIGSVAGISGIAGNSAYSASKGALISLTKSLAIEYAPKNIRFNCICPGYVQTPMLERAKKLYPDQDSFMENIVIKHPLGLGYPEDVAKAVSFLLSDGGRWSTGSVMVIDGGYSA